MNFYHRFVLEMKHGDCIFKQAESVLCKLETATPKSTKRAHTSTRLNTSNIANLISKLNFYKLIPYPMDNCFTGRHDRSRQTPEKDVLYIIPAGPVSSVHSLGGASYLLPV